MAKFTSRYPELAFYVEGELRKFHAGEYVTDDKSEIAALESLVDAVKVEEEEKSEPVKPKALSKKK